MGIPPPPPLTARHTEERNKLAASGLQNLALLLFGAVLVTPAINLALAPPAWLTIAATVDAGSAEMCAMLLLRYIPFTPDPKEAAP